MSLAFAVEPGTAGEASYALLAHEGASLEGAAARAAAVLAHPRSVRIVTAHDGARTARHGFVRAGRADGDRIDESAACGVELLALAPAGDGDGWVLRLAETRGEDGVARIALDRTVFGAERVGMLGERGEALEFDRTRVDVPLAAGEVATARVRVAP